MMQRLTCTISLESDLGTPLRGDTLFGQVCWALRLRDGAGALETALDGYTANRPFLVVSDGLPAGFAPKPELPAPHLKPEPSDVFARRKAWSKRKYIPLTALEAPLLNAYRADDLAEPEDALTRTLQPHNTIDRLTGTTGTGIFAPYQTERLSRQTTETRFTLEILVDPDRLHPDRLIQLLDDIGATGYGRDASIGLGKFRIVSVEHQHASASTPSTTWLCLAPCAPAPSSLEEGSSFWRTFTRFGRHGGPAFAGAVFKRPILMADTGAALTPHQPPTSGFIGTGLGGGDRLSGSVPGTVHQGYAPVAPLNLEGWRV